MATSLLTEECSSVAQATELFSTVEGLIVLVPKRTCQNPLSFTIPSGCYALVTRNGVNLDYLHENGEVTTTWPPGLHFPYPPWYQVSFLISKQSILLEVPIVGCKTSDDVSVDIKVGVTFRIMGDTALGEDCNLVRKFAYQLKTSGLEGQLRGSLEALIRVSIRDLNHALIYSILSNEVLVQNVGQNEGDEDGSLEISAFISDSSTSQGDTNRSRTQRQQELQLSAISYENKLADSIQQKLNEQFSPQGVQISSVVIQDIVLPPSVRNQMQSIIEQATATEEENFKHFQEIYNSRLEEELCGLIQSYEEGREKEYLLGYENINKEKVQLEDAISLSRKAEAKIREEARQKIQSIQERCLYDVKQIKDASSAGFASSLEKAQLFSAQLKADSALERQIQLSDAQIESENNFAGVDKITSTAEGKIAQWVKKRNEYNLALQRIKNLEALADNDDVIISPSSNADENLICAADSILQRGDKTSTMTSAIEIELMKVVSIVTPEKGEKVDKDIEFIRS